VLFIDLNRFKLINDTLGRKIGDELLVEVARRFRTVLRDQDLVARLGGDEFAVGLFDIGQHFEASMVAQNCSPPERADPDRRPRPARGRQHRHQRVSAGWARCETLRLADIAMYRAKQEGGDGAMWPSTAGHEPGHAGTHAHRNRLRNALGNGELLLHYQPKYAIPDGKIIGAEALVRWRHPARAGAAVGIHSAGRSDRAGGAGRRMGAGDRLRAGAGVERCRPAADPSGRERLGPRVHRHLAGTRGDTLKRYGLEPSWLELEITESTLMHNIDRVIGIMDRITALGVTLSLDDFGTGYSSLSYLKRFPIDTLKIDRSFTIGIPGDPTIARLPTPSSASPSSSSTR
jgi:diguanylate cyclase (GGDEF)-like protein